MKKALIIPFLILSFQPFSVQAQFSPCTHSNNFCQPLKGEQLKRAQARIYKDETGPREHLYVNGVDESEEFWFDETSTLARTLNSIHRSDLEKIPRFRDEHLLEEMRKTKNGILAVCALGPVTSVIGTIVGTLSGISNSDSLREFVGIVEDGVSSGATTCYSQARTYNLLAKEAVSRGLVDKNKEEQSLAEIEFGNLDYGQNINQDSRASELNEVSQDSSSRRGRNLKNSAQSR